MKTISSYFLKEFLRIFILTLAAFVLIYIFVDFLERIDNFLEARLPLSRVAYYYILSVPLFLFNVAPVAVLVSIMISLGLLARHNEIIAVKAAGISLHRVSIPLLGAGILISLLMFVISEMAIPYASVKTNAIWNLEVEKKGKAKSGQFKDVWFKGEGIIINFDFYDSNKNYLRGINLFRLNERFALYERIKAKEARLVKDGWRFSDGLVKTYKEDGQLSLETFENADFKLGQLPENFTESQRAPQEMGFEELYYYARKVEDEGHDPTKYFVDLNFKIAYPFICLVMLLIGLPIVLWRERGGGIDVGIGAGVGLSFVYLVLLGLSRSLGYTGILYPALAAWLPNILFMLVGLFLFALIRQ